MTSGNENIEFLQNVMSKSRKSDAWTAEQLWKILTKLKPNKSMDPLSMTYELFKPGNIGENLFNSLLMFRNETKETGEVIDALRLSNITSIYKMKGSRLLLDLERGIFSVVKIRSIIDKLLYQDIYPIIDSNMSDSNVGARKQCNIRDNLFVVYAVIGDALDTGVELEVALYDLAKCFDSMWWEGTSNDIWDKNICDDKFHLICALNGNCNVLINKPVGLANRFQLDQIEMQGMVNSSLKCSIQMDLIGLEMYTEDEGLYMYKNLISVPALGMVDDVVALSRCGVQSMISNSIINNIIEVKRLQFGPDKFFQIHVGRKADQCCQLKVHDTPMTHVSAESYLGDTLTSDLNKNLNIKNRTNKAIGTTSKILKLLSQISQGHHFSIGLIMRESVLISKLLLNSEVWVRLTKQQIDTLEHADLTFQRKLLNCQSKTNIELIYGELVTTLIHLTLRKCRLMYLWHILSRDDSELIKRVYNAQKFSPRKSDWINQVINDKSFLGLNLSDDEIQLFTKSHFKKIVNQKIETKR